MTKRRGRRNKEEDSEDRGWGWGWKVVWKKNRLLLFLIAKGPWCYHRTTRLKVLFWLSSNVGSQLLFPNFNNFFHKSEEASALGQSLSVDPLDFHFSLTDNSADVLNFLSDFGWLFQTEKGLTFLFYEACHLLTGEKSSCLDYASFLLDWV